MPTTERLHIIISPDEYGPQTEPTPPPQPQPTNPKNVLGGQLALRLAEVDASVLSAPHMHGGSVNALLNSI